MAAKGVYYTVQIRRDTGIEEALDKLCAKLEKELGVKVTGSAAVALAVKEALDCRKGRPC